MAKNESLFLMNSIVKSGYTVMVKNIINIAKKILFKETFSTKKSVRYSFSITNLGQTQKRGS
jgi:hypothetical protein